MTCQPVLMKTASYFYMQMIVPFYCVHKDVDFISVKLGKVLEKCSDWLIDNRFIFTFRKNRMHVVWSTKEISQGNRFSY